MNARKWNQRVVREAESRGRLTESYTQAASLGLTAPRPKPRRRFKKRKAKR